MKCSFYETRQCMIPLLPLYNRNGSFAAAILKKTCKIGEVHFSQFYLVQTVTCILEICEEHERDAHRQGQYIVWHKQQHCPIHLSTSTIQHTFTCSLQHKYQSHNDIHPSYVDSLIGVMSLMNRYIMYLLCIKCLFLFGVKLSTKCGCPPKIEIVN